MQIRITKHINKEHTLKYIRDNGTETWMRSDDFFVQHDLSHYALESILGYRTAFNGMLNSGMDIKDFEDRAKRAVINITAEAMYAETMANLFLVEIMQGEFDDFNSVQQEAFSSTNKSLQPTSLTVEQIKAVRKYLRELLQQWEDLPAEQTMELHFGL